MSTPLTSARWVRDHAAVIALSAHTPPSRTTVSYFSRQWIAKQQNDVNNSGLPICQYCNHTVCNPVLFPSEFHVTCLECAIIALKEHVSRVQASLLTPSGTPVSTTAIPCPDTLSSCRVDGVEPAAVAIQHKRCGYLSYNAVQNGFDLSRLPIEHIPIQMSQIVDVLRGRNAICPFCANEYETLFALVNHVRKKECLMLYFQCGQCQNEFSACGTEGFALHQRSGHRRLLAKPEYKTCEHIPLRHVPNQITVDQLPTCCICNNTVLLPLLFRCSAMHMACHSCMFAYYTTPIRPPDDDEDVRPPCTICPICSKQHIDNRPCLPVRYQKELVFVPFNMMSSALLRFYWTILQQVPSVAEQESVPVDRADWSKCPYCQMQFPMDPAELLNHIIFACRAKTVPCSTCHRNIYLYYGFGFHDAFECVDSTPAQQTYAQAVRDSDEPLLLPLVRRCDRDIV